VLTILNLSRVVRRLFKMIDFTAGVVERYCTADEIAEIFKVSVPAVRGWMRRGAPFEPVGRLRRFNPEKLRAWLCEQYEIQRAERKAAEQEQTAA
jgi:phage terminase Nu1 subunit (DNA packaging protein)